MAEPSGITSPRPLSVMAETDEWRSNECIEGEQMNKKEGLFVEYSALKLQAITKFTQPNQEPLKQLLTVLLDKTYAKRVPQAVRTFLDDTQSEPQKQQNQPQSGLENEQDYTTESSEQQRLGPTNGSLPGQVLE